MHIHGPKTYKYPCRSVDSNSTNGGLFFLFFSWLAVCRMFGWMPVCPQIQVQLSPNVLNWRWVCPSPQTPTALNSPSGLYFPKQRPWLKELCLVALCRNSPGSPSLRRSDRLRRRVSRGGFDRCANGQSGLQRWPSVSTVRYKLLSLWGSVGSRDRDACWSSQVNERKLIACWCFVHCDFAEADDHWYSAMGVFSPLFKHLRQINQNRIRISSWAPCKLRSGQQEPAIRWNNSIGTAYTTQNQPSSHLQHPVGPRTPCDGLINLV